MSKKDEKAEKEVEELVAKDEEKVEIATNLNISEDVIGIIAGRGITIWRNYKVWCKS